jgi:hypothetical protein
VLVKCLADPYVFTVLTEGLGFDFGTKHMFAFSSSFATFCGMGPLSTEFASSKGFADFKNDFCHCLNFKRRVR